MPAGWRQRREADHKGAGGGMVYVPAPFQPVDAPLDASTEPVGQLNQESHRLDGPASPGSFPCSR